MKHLVLSLFFFLSLLANAQVKNDAKYLAGAVPEENGVITFKKSFKVTSKTHQEVFDIMSAFVNDSLVGKGIEGMRNRIISDGKSDGVIVARVEEYMLLKKKKFLSLDRTRFRYQINAAVVDNQVNITINQISYYYNELEDGTGGINYKGEEWISDKMALNKSQTKLYPRSGKFRRVTVDRVENIFEQAKASFAEKKSQVKTADGIEEI